MNHHKFEKLLKEILNRTTTVLSTKSDEYSTDSDKLHNFKRAGNMLNCSPEKALIGMWTKHIISILDIVDEIESKCSTNKDCFPAYENVAYMKKVDEKIGDAINYLILLEALINERHNRLLGV